ncbi:MAG: polysaccharide deacetylase, partial [Aquificota bacterium]
YMEVIREKSFYQRRKAKILGYMSVGEIEKYRSYYQELKGFAVGENKMWDSLVADLRKKEYRDFLLNRVAKNIAERGFDGFFLDTLDSYMLVAKKEEYEEYQKALVDFIKALRERYPDKLIVLNRGFEVLDQVKHLVNGIMAESLFWGLDSNRNYRKVSEEDRKWLLDQLNRAKQYGLPVIVVDYVSPKNKKLAMEVLNKISSLGFIPYVADKELSRIGFSPCMPLPRRVVLLYDSSVFPIRQYADIHRLVQMPLEYLGFVPELYDINEPLPEVYPEAGYTAVISMNLGKTSKELDQWFLRAKEEGVKLFFINYLPFYERGKVAKALGLNLEENKDKTLKSLKVLESYYRPYEAPPVVKQPEVFIQPSEGKPLLTLQGEKGKRHIPFAFTPWGGYAVDHSLINEEELWVFNPFEVFKDLLVREPFPIPDTTTENGRRILTAHIDGDAFFGDTDYSPKRNLGEVIRDEVIKVYKIPHTVSIVEGEVAPYGLYPEKSGKLEEIAKSIFLLPNVEPASHSFSHPFAWQPDKVKDKKLLYGYNLPIKGYSLNYEREIVGSVDYINKLLEGSGKRVKVFLWTGDCVPDKKEIETTYKLSLFNVNGGNTTITQTEPFLKNIYPMAVNYGPYVQVYAPQQNENVYTNLWTSPFWGYINVIQTFELTDKPYRIKPMSIYYHFYSAQKVASLNALKRVYEYALSKPVNPMFLSEYAQRVLDFRETVIFKEDKGFRVRNSGYLRTLRLEKGMGYPDLEKSKGVLGYYEGEQGVYVHLDGSGDYYIELTQKPKDWFNLISSNGQVYQVKKEGKELSFKLRSYVTLEASLYTGKCRVWLNGKEVKGTYNHKGGEELEVKVVCP